MADSTPTLTPARPERTRDEQPRRRRWLFGFWAVVFVAFIAAAPGNMTFETKLGVATDPWQFLGDLGQLWSDRSSFGGIADQYIGYLFPMLPFYALTDLLQVPVWLAERLWLSIVVTTAFWGALRLAERLRVGSSGTRLLGAAAYALWPTFTIIVGSTSAGALPGSVLPWVLLPLTSATLTAQVAAARSALLIPFMGGVNATSVLAALLPVGLYVLSRTGHRRTGLLLWWIPGVILATLWWVIPLLLLGSYGEDFLPYVEQAWNTTRTMSAVEMLRGAGNWVAYLNFGEAWLPSGWLLATGVFPILGTALAAASGLAGLARRDMPERRWLMLTVITVVGIMLAGYGGALGAPFAEGVQGWLDGWLSPFRNIYKFQPGLALALAFGLAHLTAVLTRREGTGPLPGRRFVPALAAVLILPAVALPFANGDILQPGAFKKLPRHWEQTADWLADNSPHNRALVVPATAHGIYTWGSPIDQPLDVLADSPWAQRDYVPFGPPGERRAMDAVEQALLTGGEVPGLTDYLGRAGVYYVVIRNDLDPDQLGYVPPQTLKRTLEASGYQKVAGFGPLTTAGRIPPDTPVEIQGSYPSNQSVEIYKPGNAARPGQATLQPVANTAQVSGGPESLLQLSADPGFRDRPAVLTGDRHPGLAGPALQAVGDGLRRADTRFGLVGNNTSYTYTPGEKNHSGSLQNPGEKPKQILPGYSPRHQTTGTLRGAKSVTASSSGSWLFHLPQFDPVNAFDSNADTAWAEGSAGDSKGQWIRIEFENTTDIPGSIDLTPLKSDGLRPSPTAVRIETDKGRADSTLRAKGESQRVRAPRGEAKWLKLTIMDAQEERPGLTGAGFSEISIPDVRVTRLLSLPDDARDSGADAQIFSLHRATDSGGLAPTAAETGLHRQLRTSGTDDYTLSAQALAVPGNKLDELLDEAAPGSRDRITASAESVRPTGTSLSARNLVDGDLTSAWIAGDKPVIHLNWPEAREVDSMLLSPAGGISARPVEVRITSPDKAVTTAVDDSGWARFEAMETDQLSITITKTAPLTPHNPVAGENLQLPVGLNEVDLPVLDEFRVEAPKPSETFELGCGEGPMIEIDGTPHATKASGTVGDLTDRRPVDVEFCAGDERDGTVELGDGSHVVEADDTGPLAITDLTLTRGDTAPRADGAQRSVEVGDWSGDTRSVEVGDGAPAYLRTHMSANEGWKATLNGQQLASLRLDGWQQGFLVPEGATGTVKLEYTPATWYRAGLAAAGVGIAALLALAFVRRRSGTPLGEQEQPPAPSWVLGAVVLTLVLALVSGPYALVVPGLALLAWWRSGLLVPVALVGMVGAGIAAATGSSPGYADGEGAYGYPAQALALLALAAALVTVPVRHPEEPEEEPPRGARSGQWRPHRHRRRHRHRAMARRRPRHRWSSANENRYSPLVRNPSLTAQRIPFPTVDEITRHCLTGKEPETVHIEIHLPGQLDPGRLRKAVGEALIRHSRILVRQAPGRWWHRRYEWELTEGPETEPVSWPSGTLEDARRRALTEEPPLHASPPIRIEVIEQGSAVGGCVLVAVVNHTALDGPAGMRVLATAAELYGGADNSPAPAPVRNNGNGNGAEEPVPPANSNWARPARIATSGRTREVGSGIHVADLPLPTRPKGAPYTVNDQLLVATCLMTARWNQEHGRRAHPVRITMPVDDRPRTTEMPIGNGTRLVEVTFGAEERNLDEPAAVERLLRATATRTRALKAAPRPQLGFTGDLLTAPVLPVGIRAACTRALRAAAGPWASTALLSNIGRVPYPMDFGDAGRAGAVWFTAPARMPRGLSVTTASVGGDRLQLALRWSHARLDDAAGRRLGELFADSLAATAHPDTETCP